MKPIRIAASMGPPWRRRPRLHHEPWLLIVIWGWWIVGMSRR